MAFLKKSFSKTYVPVVLILSLIVFFRISYFVRAEGGENTLNELQQKRQEYEKKISDLQSKEKTLKNEIILMDSRISLTLLKISEAETQIKIRETELSRLEDDILLVGQKIDNLGSILEEQKIIFSQRASASYKSQKVGFLEMFLAERNSGFDLAYFVNRTKYLRVFEFRDNEFLKQMEETKSVFQSQRVILASKKQEVEQIKVQIEEEKKKLESFKALLIRQKTEKQNILSLTLNDEDKYQRLLTQILAEIESVARSLKGGVKIGEVKKGDTIAREGNTGCVLPSPSSANPVAGAHLHFGVYKDGVAQDPRPYLDRGDLSWPESPTTVTQNFGENYDFYMRNFGISGHNALDMSRGYGSSILAAADGTAYETGDNRQYAGWCNGKARGIRIEHPNGLITIYWHIL